MASITKEISIRTSRQGLHEITSDVTRIVHEAGLETGLCTVFIRHTSASLVIQENADPSARHDLESWLMRHVPEDDPDYTHRSEGPDDMPAHIKSALTNVSLAVPIMGGRLALGTWQGIYVWEHRRGRHERKIVVHVA